MTLPPSKIAEINLALGFTCFRSSRSAEWPFALTRQPQITRVR
jgi:hypothetical protein